MVDDFCTLDGMRHGLARARDRMDAGIVASRGLGMVDRLIQTIDAMTADERLYASVTTERQREIAAISGIQAWMVQALIDQRRLITSIRRMGVASE